MTLIVAIGCSDGVVIAADSASSDQSSGIRTTTSSKIRRVREFPLAFGGSGDVGLLQKVYDEVALGAKPDDLTKYRDAIKRRVSPVQRAAVELHVPHPAMGLAAHIPPVAVFILAGIAKGVPFILEIDGTSTDTLYNENLGSFHAIGSGAAFAHAYFRPHLNSPRTCELAEIMAYRILDDSINVAVGYVSHPIYIHTIRNNGDYKIASKNDINQLATICEAWRELERETVGNILTPNASRTAQVPALPEPSGS